MPESATPASRLRRPPGAPMAPAESGSAKMTGSMWPSAARLRRLAAAGRRSRWRISPMPRHLAPSELSAFAPARRTAGRLRSGFPPVRGRFRRARLWHRSPIPRRIDEWAQPHLKPLGSPSTRVTRLPGDSSCATSHGTRGRLRGGRPGRAVLPAPADAGHSPQAVVLKYDLTMPLIPIG